MNFLCHFQQLEFLEDSGGSNSQTKFFTEYKLSNKTQCIEKIGPFEQTVIFPEIGQLHKKLMIKQFLKNIWEEDCQN